MEYNPVSKRWAVVYYVRHNGAAISNAYRLFLYDENLKLVEDATHNTGINNSSVASHTIQEMYSDEEYIYVNYTQYGTSSMKNVLRLYDWNGNFVKEKTIDGGASGYSKDSKKSNIQNVIGLNGDLYVCAYQSSDGLHLSRVRYGNLPKTSAESLKGMQLGEVFEHSSYSNVNPYLTTTKVKAPISVDAGTKDVVTVNPDTGEEETVKEQLYIYAYNGKNADGSVISSTTTKFPKHHVSKGITTDGTYIYATLNASTGSNKNTGFDVGIIGKFDTSGKLISRTANSFYWGNGVRLSYVDGILYVSRTNAGSSSYKAVAFSNTTLAFDTNLNFIGEVTTIPGITLPEGAVLDNVAKNEFGDLAVAYKKAGVSGYFMNTYKTVDGVYELVSENIDITKASVGSTSSSTNYEVEMYGKYIYLLHSINTNPIISVHSLDGKLIKSDQIDSQAETNVDSKNYQGLVIIKNQPYIATSSWASSTTGLGLYKLSVTSYTGL